MPDDNVKMTTRLMAAKTLALINSDRKFTLDTSPPESAPGATRLIFAACNRWNCTGGAEAPLTGQSYDPGSFAFQGNSIRILHPGVYLMTCKVHFGVYDSENSSNPSVWGGIQQATVNFGHADGSYMPIVEWTPHGGYYQKQEEVIRFSEIITTFQNNQRFVLKAGATYSIPRDHPVILRAAVRSLKILRL